MLIDTHCHLIDEDIEQILNNKNCIMIASGCDDETNNKVLELIEKYDNVYGTLGIHPSELDKITCDSFKIIENNINNKKIVAVGEIGLDYYYTKENKEKQKELFEKMIALAKKHDLPVIVHSRKAIQDTYDILKEHEIKGSLHSYQGSAEMAEEFIKIGFCIGIGGTITHKNNKKAKKVLKNIGTNHMLLETDSPYLPPEEKRGESNTPLNLKYIIETIADELDLKEDEVIEITTENAKRLFKICKNMD